MNPCALPRADLQDRLTYFEVRVGNTPAATSPSVNAVCASYDSPTQSLYTLTCSTPLVGRYLLVRLRRVIARVENVLTLCEVKAYGTLPPPPPSPPT